LATTGLSKSFATTDRAPAELLDQLLAEIHRWQPASAAQHDDITLIVVDVV
jgi:hypothetical protein